MTTEPVLSYYDPKAELEIQCDARQTGLGAALLQRGRPIAYTRRALRNLVPRVSHLTTLLGRARRDPDLVWSRATLTIENIREGSSVVRQLLVFSFVPLRPPLPVMFNGSLRTESSNSIYSTVYVKVRQVYLQTIYRGRDVAVIPIGFMKSRSYLNCGCRAVHDSY